MKPALKKKWIKALRSGKYKQCGDVLREKEDGEFSFCCLGVLRHIVDPNDKRKGSDGNTDRVGLLSKKQEKEFGITYEEQMFFAQKNDSGTPFPKIADLIEKKL